MFSDKEKAISILKNGLYEGSNYKSAFICLAKFYRYLNYNKDTTKKLIIEWLERQFCEEIFDDIMVDMNSAIEDVYSKKYKFISNVNVPITLEYMAYINKLKTKGEKLVMFAMIYLRGIYGNGDDNSFYITHNKIAKLTGMTRMQVFSCLQSLSNNNHIKIINRNVTKKTISPNKDWNGDSGKRYSYPNKYILNIPIHNTDVVYNINDVDILVNDFKKCYKVCKETYKFKLTRYFREWLYKI